MSWNYRVIRKNNSGMISFEIHEVYYDENGKPSAWSENAMAPYGEETVSELLEDYKMMGAALSKPVFEVKVDVLGKEHLEEVE